MYLFFSVVFDWKPGSIVHVVYCGSLYFYFIIIVISFTELQRFNMPFQSPQSGKTKRQLLQIKVYQEACKIILKNGFQGKKIKIQPDRLGFKNSHGYWKPSVSNGMCNRKKLLVRN